MNIDVRIIKLLIFQEKILLLSQNRISFLISHPAKDINERLLNRIRDMDSSEVQ